MVVDYPNSNKAKKVFLVLFVGGGGGGHQQMPDGLEGEVREDGKVKFERRREREGKKEKGGKRKGVKDKDWILKKKEVRTVLPSGSTLTDGFSRVPAVSTTWEGRRTSRFKIYRAETQSCLLITPSHVIPHCHPIICIHMIY